jgi:16S rRNA processing protein RimM
MGNEELYYFGKILKTHGNKGHLLASCEVPEFNRIDPPDVIFVELEGDRVPFFPDQFDFLTDTTLLLRFDDVSTPEEGDPFQGCPLFIPSFYAPEKKGTTFYKEEIIGFKVSDTVHGAIGTIDAVLDFPSQTLLRILREENEILIPVVPEWIKKVDRRKKLILLSLPEGLINLNY